MNRRTVLRSLIAVPGAAAVIDAQEPVKLPPATKPAPSETPATPTVNADSFANGAIRTFNDDQYSALVSLGDILVPSSPASPGAREANAAAFLDFLIGQSPQNLLSLYRDGLDALNAQSRTHYRKRFAAITATEAAPMLSSLREPWRYAPPAEILPRFLLTVKSDLLRATASSREYITVVSQHRRAASGTGQYWFPVD